jgi:GT2 family glycosyltransferase
MNKEFPLVTANILSWNKKEELSYILRRLKEVDYPNLEIIVVDNASTDGSAEMVISEFPNVQLIRLNKNVGIAGWNKGFIAARGDYILALDHDSFPAKNAITLGIDKFRKTRNLGVIAFKIVNFHDESVHQSAEYDKRMAKYGEGNNGVLVKRFVGGGALISREVIDKVGCYSEELFLYGFEADYAMRVIKADYKVRYFPEIVAFHKVLPASQKKLAGIFYYGTRNNIWTFWQYSPIMVAIAKTLYFLPKMFLRAVIKGHVKPYLKGAFDGFKGLPRFIKKRNVVYTQTVRYFVANVLRINRNQE